MSPAADSAGQPFEGRSFQPNSFQGDTGEADSVLEAALALFTEARAGTDPAAREEAFTAVVHALHSARLLVPLMTEAGYFGVTDEGRVVEKSQELSIVHVEGPDGRAVAPLFSSVQAMGVWNTQARPVPVESARAALATVAEGVALMVLDPGSPHSLTLRRSALRAVAMSEPYTSPLLDNEVRAALASGLEPHGQVVVSFDLHSGRPFSHPVGSRGGRRFECGLRTHGRGAPLAPGRGVCRLVRELPAPSPGGWAGNQSSSVLVDGSGVFLSRTLPWSIRERRGFAEGQLH